MSTPVRVLVVDDHVFYREGIKTLLATRTEEVTVVGEAGSGEEALELAPFLAPQVVLMDLQMPGLGGIRATQSLSANHPGIAVLVLTMLDDDSVLPALRAGAKGYLLKDAGVDDIVRAVLAVANGQSVLAPQAAQRVQRQLTKPAASLSRPFSELTEREHQLVNELAHGRSNRQIAQRLGLTDKTVRNYLSTVLTKLHARDRAHLAERARDVGYPME